MPNMGDDCHWAAPVGLPVRNSRLGAITYSPAYRG